MTHMHQTNVISQTENTRTDNESLRQRIIDLEQALAIQSQIAAQQERALQRSQYLLVASPVVTYSREATGEYAVTFISENVTDIFGYKPEAFTADAHFWSSHIHPDDLSRVFADLHDLFAQGKYSHEYRFLHQDGTYRWVHDQLRLIRNAAGQPVEIVGSWQDITERKQVEDELLMFKVLVENALDGIVIVNMEGEHMYANAAIQSMSGYGTKLIGMNGFEVLDDEPHVIEAAFQQLRERGSVNFITTYRRPDGSTFPVDTTSYIINMANGESRLIGFTRDISKQQKMEAERLALQQQIIDAQRHSLRELSTPLIPITTTTVVMPLIGAIDSARAQQIMETLLEGVAAYQAETAIIDITGVQVVDTQVANALIRAAQALRLLGARVLLTGIKPQIAQTLVHLGVSLDGIQTYGSLQSGVRMALQQDMAA